MIYVWYNIMLCKTKAWPATFVNHDNYLTHWPWYKTYIYRLKISSWKHYTEVQNCNDIVWLYELPMILMSYLQWRVLGGKGESFRGNTPNGCIPVHVHGWVDGEASHEYNHILLYDVMYEPMRSLSRHNNSTLFMLIYMYMLNITIGVCSSPAWNLTLSSGYIYIYIKT